MPGQMETFRSHANLALQRIQGLTAKGLLSKIEVDTIVTALTAVVRYSIENETAAWELINRTGRDLAFYDKLRQDLPKATMKIRMAADMGVQKAGGGFR